MSKLGWKPGQSLGKKMTGILKPIKPVYKNDRSGLGATNLDQCVDPIFPIVNMLLNISESKMYKGAIPDEDLVLKVCSVFDEGNSLDLDSDNISVIRSEISAEILSNEVNCLIDTGSDVTCVSEVFWLNLVKKRMKIYL